jgi:hypothetical protein
MTTATVYHGYHGSSLANWHGIQRTGLVVLSNTQYMSAGAALGPGIYTAAAGNFGTSYAYSGAFPGHACGPLPAGGRAGGGAAGAPSAGVFAALAALGAGSAAAAAAMAAAAPAAQGARALNRDAWTCVAVLRVEPGVVMVTDARGGPAGTRVVPSAAACKLAYLILVGGISG